MILEIAARFGAGGAAVGGGCPVAWWESLRPAVQAMLMVWVVEKRREEAREKRGP